MPKCKGYFIDLHGESNASLSNLKIHKSTKANNMPKYIYIFGWGGGGHLQHTHVSYWNKKYPRRIN